MAEEAVVQELDSHIDSGEDSNRISQQSSEISNQPCNLATLIDDDVYQALKKHFNRKGKGRPPGVPQGLAVSNRLLLQLYFLKEETQHSFDDLKAWLEKLVPHTATVTEGRIRHRINTLLKTCDALSIDECRQILEEEHDFQALDEPLAALGLTRLHLNGTHEFISLSLPDITNHVVVALENFRSLTRKPATFVSKWLNSLCAPCNQLSQKQLKLRVQKVIKKARDFSKNKDLNGLDAFYKCSFLDSCPANAEVVPPPNIAASCTKCDDLSGFIKDKDDKIKQLEKRNEESVKVIEELELKTSILTEDLKSNKLELQEVGLHAPKQKLVVDLQRENRKLKAVNSELEQKVDALEDKSRTYKINSKLRHENEYLQSQVRDLEIKVEKATNIASFDNVKNLKRKLACEQSQKSKWKAKFSRLEDSLVSVEENESDSDDEPLMQLRENHHNKFNSKVRFTYMALQGEADIPASKCNKVVEIVSKHLHNKNLKNLPSTSTVLNMADEGHHIAKQHVAEKMLNSNHLTFSSDGTSRQKRHYMERHVVLDDGTVLSLGFTEIASDDAKSMLEQAVEILEELSQIHCSAHTGTSDDSTQDFGEKVNNTLVEILKKIKSLMSDRAANMKAFDKIFHEYKQEQLGPDDASTLFLFCNAHFLLGLSTGTEKVLRDLESEISEPETSFGGPFLFYDQQASLALVRCAAEVFGPRGDEKNGCREEWLVFCGREKIKSLFCSYRNNRFNNVFENSCALIFHKDHIVNFLDNYCSHNNKKLKSVRDALNNNKILSTVLAVALFNKLLTGPYWDLMNSKKPYSAFADYVHQIDTVLADWISLSDPDEIAILEPVFKDFEVKIPIDFLSLLTSGDYCRGVFVVAFSRIGSEMHEVLKRQLSDFVGEGIFAGEVPQDVKCILDKCPLTNLTGERLFGDLDYDIQKRRHCSTHQRTTLNMWKHNQTGAWLQRKCLKEQDRILKSAQKNGNSLRKEHMEAVRREKMKIMKRIEENEQKKHEKEVLDLQQKNKILDAILKTGFCTTKEQLEDLWVKGTVEDLKNQLRYRKIFLSDKSIKVTGTKEQLYDQLLKCISQITE